MLVVGAIRFEVENENLEPAKYSPHCIIVGRGSRRQKISAEDLDEVAHPFGREPFEVGVSCKGCTIGQLPGPMQNLLARSLDSSCRPRDRDRKFITARAEFALLHGNPHVRHHVLELSVSRCEGERPLGLDF
jgi:hypothetical protein